ncbi:MAG: CIA30 family protein [Akkermansiaceae bacterium]
MTKYFRLFALSTLFSTYLASADPANENRGGLILQDFDNAAEAGKQWKTVNDNVMGGRSKGGPAFADGKLTFSGSTNTNGGGFSSIRTNPAPVDLSGYAGILMRIKSDGRGYTTSIRTNVSRGAWKTPFRAALTAPAGEWATVFVPFEDFKPTMFGNRITKNAPKLDVSKFQSVGFHLYDKKDGPFKLEVDWIKAVKKAPKN